MWGSFVSGRHRGASRGGPGRGPSAASVLGRSEQPVASEGPLDLPHSPATPHECLVLLPCFDVHCWDPFRLATAIGVGENDALSTAATLLTLGLVGDDDVLAGDVLAAGLAMMFRLRSGLRGSQSRMARPTPSQPLREQGKRWAVPQLLLSMRTEDGVRRLNSCCYEMKTEDCVRLPRSPCGSKQRYVQDHGRRREYPTLGGVLAPSQADLPPRDIIMMMRGERLE